MSDLASPSDPTGTNTGHTIPATFENWKYDEISLLKSATWVDASTMISKKRKFINAKEELLIKKGTAFTIEPRPVIPNNPDIPMVWFHTIALFKQDSTKELLTGFDKLFTLTGMDYMMQ